MANPITLSVIKADVGGYVGHSSMHPALLDGAREHVSQAIERKLLIDGYVTHCGDDLELIMTHRKGVNNAEIHKFAWDTFVACTEIAKRLKLYGAGQDLLARRNGVRRAQKRTRGRVHGRQDLAWRMEFAAVPNLRQPFQHCGARD